MITIGNMDINRQIKMWIKRYTNRHQGKKEKQTTERLRRKFLRDPILYLQWSKFLRVLLT